jgi:hypothetical protein
MICEYVFALVKLRKTLENQCSGRDSNGVPPGYNSEDSFRELKELMLPSKGLLCEVDLRLVSFYLISRVYSKYLLRSRARVLLHKLLFM